MSSTPFHQEFPGICYEFWQSYFDVQDELYADIVDV